MLSQQASVEAGCGVFMFSTFWKKEKPMARVMAGSVLKLCDLWTDWVQRVCERESYPYDMS